MKHSEIASSYNNWIEHFDTNAAMTEAEFEATPMDKRLALLQDAFGDELVTTEDDSEAYCEECGVVHEGGTCPENDRRAKAAAATLKYFAKHGGEWITGEKVMSPDMIEQNMSDLLCNFAHYCDLNGVQMSDVLRRAKGHYDAEAKGRDELQQFYAE
jgi:hypothetical protein